MDESTIKAAEIALKAGDLKAVRELGFEVKLDQPEPEVETRHFRCRVIVEEYVDFYEIPGQHIKTWMQIAGTGAEVYASDAATGIDKISDILAERWQTEVLNHKHMIDRPVREACRVCGEPSPPCDDPGCPCC